MKKLSLDAAVEALCKEKKTTRCALAREADFPRSTFTRIRQGYDVRMETLKVLRKIGVKHPLVEAA